MDGVCVKPEFIRNGYLKKQACTELRRMYQIPKTIKRAGSGRENAIISLNSEY